jgi:hypothetical protein
LVGIGVTPLEIQKPVRRTASREKRKNFISAQLEEESETRSGKLMALTLKDDEVEEEFIPKNSIDSKTISNYLQKNFLFQHLTIAQMNLVVNVMKPLLVQAGDVVIRQGDRGTDKNAIVDELIN